MSWVAVAVGGATLVAGVYSANQAGDAADEAAAAQSGASAAGIAEQRRQFEAMRQLLAPYVNAGTGALAGMGDLAGTNGAGQQQAAIDALQASPAFTSALQTGEEAMLQNASATGGLRGGNIQGALAQFRPNLLAATINDQYNRLGGLASMGQNSAAMVGNAGLNTGNNVSQLLQQSGAAQAGGIMGGAAANIGMANSLSSAAGLFAAMYGRQGGTSTQGQGTFNGVRF